MSRGLFPPTGGGSAPTTASYFTVGSSTLVGSDIWTASGDGFSVNPPVPGSDPTTLAALPSFRYIDTGKTVEDAPRIFFNFEPSTFPANQSELIFVYGVIVSSGTPDFGVDPSKQSCHHFGAGTGAGNKVGVKGAQNNTSPSVSGGYSNFRATRTQTMFFALSTTYHMGDWRSWVAYSTSSSTVRTQSTIVTHTSTDSIYLFVGAGRETAGSASAMVGTLTYSVIT